MLGIGIETARDPTGDHDVPQPKRSGNHERSTVNTKTSLALRLTRRPRAVTAAGVPPGAEHATPSAAAYPARRTGITRRLLALVAATITAAGIMTAVGTRPASAAANDDVCLTNSNSNCLWGEVIGGLIAIQIYDVLKVITIWIQKKVGEDDQGNPEEEEKDSSTGLCLADTGLRPGPGSPATEAPCGADGTVWILVKDTDGYYMYSRYSVDNDFSMALTVDPLSNGAPVYLDITAPTNHALWQQFTYF
jgi:hypothetical protein